jgi:hypothetical protein
VGLGSPNQEEFTTYERREEERSTEKSVLD